MNFKQWMTEGGWIGNDGNATDVNTSGDRGGQKNGPSKHPNPPPGVATPSSNAPFALAQRTGAAPTGQQPAGTGAPLPQPNGQQPQLQQKKMMKKKMKK